MRLRGRRMACCRSARLLRSSNRNSPGTCLRAPVGGGALDDEIHNRLPILRSEWVMPLAFLFDDRDLPAEFPIALLGDPRLAFEPGVKAAAHVEERHVRRGERG